MPEDSQAVQIAVLQRDVQHLTEQVADLTTSVKELTAIMNRGKGAFAASLALAGATSTPLAFMGAVTVAIGGKMLWDAYQKRGRPFPGRSR